ncbi:unnamed protein product [Mytilus coruscus]|uniref:Uncharacterized protein n=1 Tax=Mytilus coruscus TaxID=42192 RepID=A0A6J8ENS1_MYTCO|nr:unnamed protein product [Mytilus coruscus]
MNFPEVSTHSSLVLKASGISLPVTKLRQDVVKLMNTALRIFTQDARETSMLAGCGAECLFGLTWKKSDVMFESDADVIMINKTYKVHGHIVELERAEALYPKLNHVLHQPDNTCPGYARLAVKHKYSDLLHKHDLQGMVFLQNNMKEQMYQISRNVFPDNNVSVHGPAVTSANLLIDTIKFLQAGCTIPMNFKLNEYRPATSTFKDIDVVPCLRGDKWPGEAAEWVTRQRLVSWPTEQTIQKIIKSGYILAGVGSKESKHSEIQWRISFNEAEQFLIETFNETQIHCIWLLKSLKTQLSKKAGKNITSYTMQNVMYWCLEEKSNEYWQASNLVCCFCFCISKLKFFVKTQYLPNYFIIKRNLLILSEFSITLQKETISYLERVLENPKASIISCLPKCDISDETPILERKIEEVFIMEWIAARTTILTDYCIFPCPVWDLYDGYNIEKSFQRCENATEKMSTINYSQPYVKTLINCMAILQYSIFVKEREIDKQISDIDKRKKCLKYMKLGFKGDKTNSRLRIATCYLDNSVKGKYQILKIIRRVTDKKYVGNLLKNYQFLNQTRNEVFKKFENITRKRQNSEIEIYNSVIDEDLTYQDPYKTFKLFKQLKKDGHEVGSYKLCKLIWNECCFDVTFMPAEVSILPKPAALELCIDPGKNRVSFNPISYGFLLEFLWHVKNDSIIKERKKVIEKMEDRIKSIPEGQQSTELNFITYCCALQQDYYSASRYLIRSFKLNPVETNVAYLYIKYIINLLMRTMR